MCGYSGCVLNSSRGIIRRDCTVNSEMMPDISCTGAYSSLDPLTTNSNAQSHTFLNPKIPFDHINLVSEIGNQVRINFKKGVCAKSSFTTSPLSFLE